MTADAFQEINAKISEIEARLSSLDNARAELAEKLTSLKTEKQEMLDCQKTVTSFPDARVTHHSPPEEKIALFRSLFRGRQDVYPRRWENAKTGRSGWQPACANEWARGICDKRKIKCSECLNRELLPVTDAVIRNHLMALAVHLQGLVDQGVVRDYADIARLSGLTRARVSQIISA